MSINIAIGVTRNRYNTVRRAKTRFDKHRHNIFPLYTIDTAHFTKLFTLFHHRRGGSWCGLHHDCEMHVFSNRMLQFYTQHCVTSAENVPTRNGIRIYYLENGVSILRCIANIGLLTAVTKYTDL